VNPHPGEANPDQAIRIARYNENCEQARHHETLRERTTSMVAQTTGVMLGLLGIKEGTWKGNPIGLLIPVFIVVLGLWGLFSSLLSESRIRRHRDRIEEIRTQLDPAFQPTPPMGKTVLVWVVFHIGVIILGTILLVIIVRQA
jgi:hypothetical protein